MNEPEINLNWPILGNGHAVKFLAKSLKKSSVAGTYIFSGPDDLGKTTIANYFAYSLLCQNKATSERLPCGECAACRQNHVGQPEDLEGGFGSVHADVHFLKRDKDKKNISIEQIREFIRSLEMSSFLNSYKIGIIKHAESLSEAAANALLKTLEEPRDQVVIILITSDLEAIPATIISRSQVLRFFPVKTEVVYNYLLTDFGASRSRAKNLAKLSLGRPALAVKFFEDEDFYSRYLKRTEAFLAFSADDLNERFNLIKELLPEKLTGPEAVKIAKRIISVWQGLIRDLILLNFGQDDLIQHEIVLPELRLQRSRYSLAKLLNFSKNLTQAEIYLGANVSPSLALESAVLTI